MAQEHDGQVTFLITGDDSNLEKDLENAKKKITKATKETSDKTEKTEKQTSEKVKKEKEEVTEHHKTENKKRVSDDEETGSKREKVEKKTSDKMKSILSGSAKAIGAATVATGAAIGSVGVMAVNTANNMDKAMNQYIASTGKGKEETEQYQKILEKIYVNNYGDSFEDIGNAMATVNKNLGEMSDEQLQKTTEAAFLLRDVFEYDIQESTRAAKAMVDSFGISSEEAFNLMAVGAQNGLDYSGELIDSISEYSVQFAKVGLDADDMFKIFQKGAETGAWNLDKVGDAIKEMSIRVIDGSDTTKQGFEAIGLNADEMAKKFSKGGESAKEAFHQMINALANMKDPIAQNTAGVNLFGTMWEDLGPEVVTQLANISDGAYATAEDMDKLNQVKYDDLGSMFEGLTRAVEMLLLPLGEMLIPVLTEVIEDILPVIQEQLPPLIDTIGEIITTTAPLVADILPVLVDLFSGLIPIVQSVVEQFLPIIQDILPVLLDLFTKLIDPVAELIQKLLPPLIKLVEVLLPVLINLIDLLMPILDLFIEILYPILDLINDGIAPLIAALTPLIGIVANNLIPILQILLSVILEVFTGFAKHVISNVQIVINILNNIIDFIKNVFTGNWKGAWQNIVNIFKSIWDGIVNFVKQPLNYCIDLVNGFIKGLNKIKVPDWIPGIGGKGINLPTIPRLKVGMDFVPSDFFPAYLDYGERVLTQEQNAKFNALGGVEGMERALSRDNYSTEQKIILGKGCIVVQTNLDGKAVASTTAPYIDTELGDIQTRKGRNG